ncbi:hypothetical protein [Phytoactinopolyspora endophytica]|uniref:hypothetical protein n=1 Tax=Phytoactinopolyspora endophytica TaxID=1642495 RepID=UPI00101CB79B|nr:hypothetical protein [Phytoactinopolyspora endophytica]
MKRWYVLGPLAGIGAGLTAFGLGVQGWRPVLIGIVVTGFLIWAKRYWPEGSYFPWPLAARHLYGGGSHQVGRLTTSISQRVRGRTPDPGLQHRLRRLAVARLHRIGVAWDDPRAAQLLGHDVYNVLVTDQFNPDLHGVGTIVTAIERLDDADAEYADTEDTEPHGTDAFAAADGTDAFAAAGGVRGSGTGPDDGGAAR